MNFVGQNISLTDALFVDNITGDLETWRIKSESVTRVLVFPPVNNYHRFLIHKVVETGFPEFTTFSVGEDQDRRTVVCFQQHLLDFTLGITAFDPASESDCDTFIESEYRDTMGEGMGDVVNGESSLDNDFEELSSDPLTTSAKARRPAQTPSTNVDGNNVSPESAIESSEEVFLHYPSSGPSRRAVAPSRRKRPERAVYIPPSRSQPLNPSAAPYISPTASPTRVEGSSQPLNPSATPWVSPPTSPSHISPASSAEGPKYRGKKPDRGVYVPPRGRGKQIKCSIDLNISNGPNNTSLSGTSSPCSPAPTVETEDATDQVVTEITAAVGGVQIEVPVIDYLAFQTSDSTINIDQFGHVIELYDFPGHFTTQDIMSAFQAFTSSWDIKWVDDTHALGVFTSPESAALALAAPHPTIKSRPLNMATTQSKLKARSVCELLLPYKARPATSTAPARRLLQWALGSDKKVPAASKVEQERLKEAIKRKDEERRRRRKEEREGEEKKLKSYTEHDDR